MTYILFHCESIESIASGYSPDIVIVFGDFNWEMSGQIMRRHCGPESIALVLAQCYNYSNFFQLTDIPS